MCKEMHPLERAARALAEHDIRMKRKWDTAPERLEEIIPASIDGCWRKYLPQVRVVVSSLLEMTDEMEDVFFEEKQPAIEAAQQRRKERNDRAEAKGFGRPAHEQAVFGSDWVKPCWVAVFQHILADTRE